MIPTDRRWYVKDSHTGNFAIKRAFNSLRGAHRAADRLDQQYGAVRYIVVLA